MHCASLYQRAATPTVLTFIMHWRYYVVSAEGKRRGLTLEANFLTRETFLDLVTACHGCILRFPQFRDNWDRVQKKTFR